MHFLRIENFKCFYDVAVPINSLTVLSGANGNGKSTVIQALLFLRRSLEHCAKWENERYVLEKENGLNVELNGPYCLALGNSSYIQSRDSDVEYVSIGIYNENDEFNISYRVNGELWLTPTHVINDFKTDHGLFYQEFYYLNAERIGPRISQEIKFFDFPNTGYQGEFVAQLLGDTETNYQIKIDSKRKNDKSNSPYLEQQVNAWLSYIMPGVSVVASYNIETHSAQIKVDNYYTKGDPTISTNIGFGISYILPIIVTGLIARKGSYMIIENPEAHLHPSAQSKIGRFLSVIANSGVIVIIETHSDHLINGLQISVASGEINSDAVTINFFSENKESFQPDLKTISLNNKGELSNWPNGFFDQSQIDFAELFNIKKDE